MSQILSKKDIERLFKPVKQYKKDKLIENEAFTMETRKLVVSGLVQGVGFRWSTQMLANKMGIPGTVRNNSDGTVTIYIQGEPSELDHFIEKLPSASGFAHIENIDQELASNVEKMHSFNVLY